MSAVGRVSHTKRVVQRRRADTLASTNRLDARPSGGETTTKLLKCEMDGVQRSYVSPHAYLLKSTRLATTTAS
jgi:hypothetical protein